MIKKDCSFTVKCNLSQILYYDSLVSEVPVVPKNHFCWFVGSLRAGGAALSRGKPPKDPSLAPLGSASKSKVGDELSSRRAGRILILPAGPGPSGLASGARVSSSLEPVS
eukprot:1157594-Pelagomonas_calceolata.AAC.8